ncbi:hypothetical protein B0T20DRAFT_487625 [Sordaria brevicollis]|uniref:Uncharacterized protein n=1 Tax=Sordaria brevicollis TaxID=83679 RepID=A0AAE0U9W8_SORBR|nr:hypothetical protein B0T20DRAFT_487625 [Sordaria brevicollis]
MSSPRHSEGNLDDVERGHQLKRRKTNPKDKTNPENNADSENKLDSENKPDFENKPDTNGNPRADSPTPTLPLRVRFGIPPRGGHSGPRSPRGDHSNLISPPGSRVRLPPMIPPRPRNPYRARRGNHLSPCPSETERGLAPPPGSPHHTLLPSESPSAPPEGFSHYTLLEHAANRANSIARLQEHFAASIPRPSAPPPPPSSPESEGGSSSSSIPSPPKAPPRAPRPAPRVLLPAPRALFPACFPAPPPLSFPLPAAAASETKPAGPSRFYADNYNSQNEDNNNSNNNKPATNVNWNTASRNENPPPYHSNGTRARAPPAVSQKKHKPSSSYSSIKKICASPKLFTKKVGAELREMLDTEETKRLHRRGLDPETREVFEECCRNRGFVVRPLMCRFETTDGFDYVQGMKQSFPSCLWRDKRCFRGLDPSFGPEVDEVDEVGGDQEGGKGKEKMTEQDVEERKMRVREKHYMENYDRWMELGITKSPVIVVADRMNKIRAVILRYRIMNVGDMEGAGDDLRLVVNENKKFGEEDDDDDEDDESDSSEDEDMDDDRYVPGWIGLKVFDFRKPGVESLELQIALGEVITYIFDCFDDVESVLLTGGGGPSYNSLGDVDVDYYYYPASVDERAKMQRYMDMEDNVRRLALGLGFEREIERVGPRDRWIFKYDAENLRGLMETLDSLNGFREHAEVEGKQERERQYRKQLFEDGKAILTVGGARAPASATRTVVDGLKAKTQRELDDFMIQALAEHCDGEHLIRTRRQGFRPMPGGVSASKTPLEDKEKEDIGLGELVEWFDRLPPLDNKTNNKDIKANNGKKPPRRMTTARMPLPEYRGLMMKSAGMEVGKDGVNMVGRESPEEPSAFRKVQDDEFSTSDGSLSSESNAFLDDIDDESLDEFDISDELINEANGNNKDGSDNFISEANLEDNQEMSAIIADGDEYHFTNSPVGLENAPPAVHVVNVEDVAQKADDDKKDDVEVDVKSVNPDSSSSSDEEETSHTDMNHGLLGNFPGGFSPFSPAGDGGAPRFSPGSFYFLCADIYSDEPQDEGEED